MANEHNLRNFPKGVSGNPAGRPKGSPSRTSIARYVLAMAATPAPELLAALKAQYPNIDEPFTIELIGTLRLAKKMIDEGDVRAYSVLMDSAYGKPKQELEQTNINAEREPHQMGNAELAEQVRIILAEHDADL